MSCLSVCARLLLLIAARSRNGLLFALSGLCRFCLQVRFRRIIRAAPLRPGRSISRTPFAPLGVLLPSALAAELALSRSVSVSPAAASGPGGPALWQGGSSLAAERGSVRCCLVPVPHPLGGPLDRSPSRLIGSAASPSVRLARWASCVHGHSFVRIWRAERARAH